MNTSKIQSSKYRVQSLRGKRVLITAGPTWVAIDSVRVISNTATADTGKLLAEKLIDKGAKVTLVINAENKSCLNKKIKILNFRFFDQLEKIITRELSSGIYDFFIHSAAVSDYQPVKSLMGKIDSDRNKLCLNLIPTPKIINRIKKIDSSIFLVGFKYEPKAKKAILLRQAKRLMNRSGSDIVIANTTGENGYQAYILGRNKVLFGPVKNKLKMVKSLIEIIEGSLKKTLQNSN